jgi:hypothetical protein
MEIEKLGNSIYKSALGQTYLSIPIIRLCESLASSNIHDSLKHNFNTVVDSWKDSVLYLINNQKRSLEDKIIKWQTTMVNHPTEEIRAFQLTLKMTGITNSSYEKALENYLNIFLMSEAKFSQGNQFKIVVKVLIALAITFIIITSLFKLISGVSQEIKAYISIFTLVGVGAYVKKRSTPIELKELKSNFSIIKSLSISRNDFHLGIK